MKIKFSKKKIKSSKDIKHRIIKKKMQPEFLCDIVQSPAIVPSRSQPTFSSDSEKTVYIMSHSGSNTKNQTSQVKHYPSCSIRCNSIEIPSKDFKNYEICSQGALIYVNKVQPLDQKEKSNNSETIPACCLRDSTIQCNKLVQRTNDQNFISSKENTSSSEKAIKSDFINSATDITLPSSSFAINLSNESINQSCTSTAKTNYRNTNPFHTENFNRDEFLKATMRICLVVSPPPSMQVNIFRNK